MLYLSNMKKHRGKQIVQITSPQIEAYAEDHTTPESDEIAALVASSNDVLEYTDMLSGRVVGQFLKIIIQISGAKRALEIGTFTGYSAIMMAEALPDDGKVTTIEMNMRYQILAEQHFRKTVHRHKIEMIKGNAREIIPGIDQMFDLVYMDADKLQYQFYFENILPKVNSGGIIITDNVLWDGTVLYPQDHKAQAIADFNKAVSTDERVDQVMLPVRDGIFVIRKK